VGGQPGPDGYQKLEYPAGTPWNLPITVWRNATYAPSFDPGYSYRVMPRNTNDVLAIDYNGTAPVQMAVSSTSSTQPMSILASGANWKIKQNTSGKCLDLNGGATAAWTQVVLNVCNGASSQAWTITPDTMTGAFYVKNAAAGRCLGDGGSTATPQPFYIFDCATSDTSQKFDIQAL